jgi:hypothetical protein
MIFNLESNIGTEVPRPMGDTPMFASPREALGMFRAVMGYLSADAAGMAAEAQAERLLALEEMDAVKTAARAQLIAAFTAVQGYSADGDYSPRSWLIHRTKITKGAAAAHLAWTRRAAAHPQIAAALAEALMSESYARKICEWSDKLPPDCRMMLVLNRDGTTTAWNPDRTKVLHSHGPPAAAQPSTS